MNKKKEKRIEKMIILLGFTISCIILATICICWKILGWMVSLLFMPFRSKDEYEHDYFAEDQTAIWFKGTEGQYFKYDLSKRDEERKSQDDDLHKFMDRHSLV